MNYRNGLIRYNDKLIISFWLFNDLDDKLNKTSN